MTKAALTIATVIITTLCYAQNKTYIGAEAAVSSDIYDIVDNFSGLKNSPLITGLWGFTIRHELSNHLFLETGLLRKYYNEGISFKISSGYTETNAINAWLVPLRLGTKINLHKDKIHLVPVIGYIYCINSDYGYGDGSGSGYEYHPNGDSMSYNYKAFYNFNKAFPLLQTCMGLEFKLLQSALINVSVSYYTGFKKVILQDINYSVNNSPVQTATALSKGEMVCLGVGFKYAISDLWLKKKSR